MLIELVELYNFAIVTFDLEGQGQGQIGKKSIFRQKSPLVSRKKHHLPQFLIESHNIPYHGRPLVGAKKLLEGILIWRPLATEWFFELEPPDHYESIFQKF